MQCPQCRAEVPAGARFCPSCGHELVVVGDQRRVATVLFADIVGFTGMAETRDPEQIKGLVDDLFDRLVADIESFGGRIDKVLGDALVALFGAPVAHEDDAERAVRAALRMQHTVATFAADIETDVQLRIGVNTGEVVVGAVSGGREYTAMGDVVNTASRLQTAARPGSVLVGPDTYAGTRHVIAYESMGLVNAKGREEPVAAWVAVEAIAPPGSRPVRVRAPLTGRDAELAMLDNLIDTAIDRSRASLLLIHGEAGMGKSRLSTEAAAHAVSAHEALVLDGRCVPYGEANIWWPVAEAIRGACGIDTTTSRADAREALRVAATTSLSASGRSDEIDRVVAGLEHLLWGGDAESEVDVSRAREEATRSVVALAEGFSRTRPLVVVLSDLHWADDEVLELVDMLLDRLSRRQFVLLATARRSLRERWNPTSEQANTMVLHLDPLSEESSRCLLHELTAGALSPGLTALLVERAGGNPFYLEELVALVDESASGAGLDEIVTTDGGDLPSSLRGLVAARLDALSPLERSVLDDAAVLGRRSKVDSLVTMAEVKRKLDRDAAHRVVEWLAAREFLVLDQGTYSFRSEVIREVAYSTLTKADRARSHYGIAKWLSHREPEHRESTIDQIANHYACAAELLGEIGLVPGVSADVVDLAVESLREAAVRADLADLPKVSDQLATRTLRLLGTDDPRRHVVLRHRAKARIGERAFVAARTDAVESRALAERLDDAAGVAEAVLVLGEIAQSEFDTPRALQLLADAHDRFVEIGDLRGQASALRLRGMAMLFSGDFVSADECFIKALGLFEEVGDRRGAAWAHQNLSWSAYTTGRVDEADHRLGLALETFDDIGDLGGITWTRGLQAWVRFHQGNIAEAERLADVVERDARERGEQWGLGMMLVLKTNLTLWTGRTAEAVEFGRRAKAAFEGLGDAWGSIQSVGVLARAMVMTGDVTGGLAVAEEAHAAATEQNNDPTFTSIVLLSIATQVGDVALGRAVAERLGEAALDEGFVGSDDLAVAVTMHRLQRGDTDAVDALLQPHGTGSAYVNSARALVAATVGEPEIALREAVLTDTPGATYLDRTTASLATALARFRLGDPGAARKELAEAKARVDETGDRVAQCVVRMAEAAVAHAAEDTDAPIVALAADSRLRALGIDARGWETLFNRALRGVAAT